ncbi:hypothetical protein GCM10008083_21680 [Ulvibacter litoralis]|nr:hypothetical protein GCM10008083_21680 [Ulvibacter litoralis]
MLDINSSDSGMLIPRVALTGDNSLSAINLTGTTLEKSTLIYNTATVTGTNAVTPGFYYWNGVDKWIGLENDWKLKGNSISSGDFLGTTNSQALVVKTNNSTKFTIPSGASSQTKILSEGLGSESAPVYSFTNSSNSGMYMHNTTNLSLSSTGKRFFSYDSFGAGGGQVTVNPDGDPDMNFQVRADSGVIISTHPTRNNVEIGANNNPEYASLYLSKSNQGFLTNRMKINDLTSSSPIISTPVDGLMVWNTGPSSGSITEPEGLYFWQNSRWRKIYTHTEDLVPSSSGYDIGSSTNRYNTIYLQNVPDISSDRRLKSNIIPLVTGLSFISKMNPVSYFLNHETEEKTHYGFIAQEIQEILPEVVTTNDDGMLSMKYTELIPILTKGIKEQQVMINSQAEMIQKLEDRLNAMEAKLNQ